MVEFEDEKNKNPGFGVRHTLALLGFLGNACMYAMRFNFSVAIVAMVKNGNEQISPNSTNYACPLPNATFIDVSTKDKVNISGEFDWDEQLQGLLLGSFFYGYIFTNIPGGRAAEYWGGRYVVGIGVLISAILSLLSPIAARTSTYLFLAVRIMEGLALGVAVPAYNTLIATWYPKDERSKFTSLIYAGTFFGSVVTLETTGLLCNSSFLGGWPSTFYIFGGLSLLWSLAWIGLVRDDPKQHPTISEEECRYVIKGCPERTRRQGVPLKSILTSLPFYATAMIHFGFNWGYFTLLTETPTYLDRIQHVDMKSNGFMSSLPYLAACIFSIVFSLVTDKLISQKIITVLTLRRISMAISGYLPMAGLIVMCFVNCNHEFAFGMLVAIGACLGAAYCGYMCSHADNSPTYAGTLMGITNTLASIPGFLAPAITGVLTNNNETLWAWREVFLIGAVIYAISTTFYLIFVSADVQPWDACEDTKNSKELKEKKQSLP